MTTADLSVMQIVVPLLAAAIGGVSVFAVSWYLKQQELYAEAAQRINDYIDDAAGSLKEMDSDKFDHERAEHAMSALNAAVFHSRRLESKEVTSRLEVAQFVLWDVIDAEERTGRVWINRAMNDATNAVVEFMILPRLWPLHRRRRILPPNQFPNTVDLYWEVAESQEEREKPNWAALRRWITKRGKELRDMQ